MCHHSPVAGKACFCVGVFLTRGGVENGKRLAAMLEVIQQAGAHGELDQIRPVFDA